MGRDQTCELLCETEPIPTEDAKFINQCITDGYAMNWVIDGLPAAHEDRDEHTQELYYNIGFSLGYTNNGQPALNNHYKISIYYHDRPDGKRRVVGVVVHPISKDTKLDAQGKPDCSPENLAFYLKEDGKSKVVYTYDVEWLVSIIGDFLSYVWFGSFILLLLAFGNCMGHSLGHVSSYP